MLDSLGLDSQTEQVYRAMLAQPHDGVTMLALRLALPESEVRRSLDRLSALALIQPSAAEPVGFRALNPERGLEALLARQQAEVAAQNMKLEASRAAAAQLIAELSFTAGVPDFETEHLVGPATIRDRLADLGDTLEEEVMTFAPGGAHTAEDLAASREPNAALLSRGVRMRTIYLESARNHAATREHVSWLSSQGARVRTAPTLPVRMIIMDRRKAVLPANTSDASVGALVLSGEGIVAALCALFESTWATATPLGTTPANPDSLPSQEAEVLNLLAQGFTDEVIAKRLGVSPRTARRIAADLMTRLEARSRFEAGVHAVQNGWLPATR
ncbi:LuxR C-terminal-related transcriptional regulator [Kitasatospora cineracea]|uniref:LuxR C-terminal-related transcriptional regulator n=1 Tax=Kitasatospora cineracea TaxID=88074 RepID=UPI0033E2620C